MSTIYSAALKAFLNAEGAPRQADLAADAMCTQAAISRYAKGIRLPPREIAERIEGATGGKVSVSLWRVVAAERAGLAA